MEGDETAVPMMEENDGTGDGECGNWMLWIGSPVDGGDSVDPVDGAAVV
jgi:hypothetical protein